jgi:hypothetical protein
MALDAVSNEGRVQSVPVVTHLQCCIDGFFDLFASWISCKERLDVTNSPEQQYLDRGRIAKRSRGLVEGARPPGRNIIHVFLLAREQVLISHSVA